MPTPEEIKKIARRFELDMYPTMPDMLSAKAMLEWLSKDYCIVPKEVINEDFIKMAADYAMYLDPDNKVNREMISVDSLGYLNWVLEKYCIVPKSVIKQWYDSAKKTADYFPNAPRVSPLNRAKVTIEILSRLFGKSLFNEEKK